MSPKTVWIATRGIKRRASHFRVKACPELLTQIYKGIDREYTYLSCNVAYTHDSNVNYGIFVRAAYELFNLLRESRINSTTPANNQAIKASLYLDQESILRVEINFVINTCYDRVCFCSDFFIYKIQIFKINYKF